MNAEISHRVKNNLMMVTGLLQMQALEQADAEVAFALKETLTRLLAFASIHEQLQSTGPTEVDLLDVARRIGDVNRRVFTGSEIEISVEGSPVILGARMAANLSVVLNELITNAVKHGAPGSDGVLRVSVHVGCEDGSLEATVRNSGDTLPVDFDLATQQNMGLRLVSDVVVDQAGGTFALAREDGGTMARISVPEAALR
jgi:two-component system, sensor histidine kinase PdtaS